MERRVKPSLEELSEQIGNPLFMDFLTTVQQQYKSKPLIEYSCCSWQRGWNVKLKKGSRSLCTIYPKEGFFQVLIVIGQKEKERMESLLSSLSLEVQECYRTCQEGNGQRWLLIDLEDIGRVYRDVITLISLRFDTK